MRKYEGEPDYAAGDYDETERRFAQGWFFHTVVGWLIVVNVAVYLLEIIIGHAKPAAFGVLFGYLALFPKDVFAHGCVWQLLTYAFLHDPANILHILLNMLFLFWFGREIEIVWGARRFLAFYLTAAAFAALAFAAVHYFIWPLQAPCVGASGAIMALVMVYALWWPNRTILFMFLFPMRVWTFVLIVIGIEAVSLVQTADNGVANLAHLAGLLYGYLVVRVAPRLSFLITGFPAKKLSALQEARKAADERRLDGLLEKVHRQGVYSLAWRERRFLKKMSRRR
jgi:membrane associated rhomboid family serine protease